MKNDCEKSVEYHTIKKKRRNMNSPIGNETIANHRLNHSFCNNNNVCENINQSPSFSQYNYQSHRNEILEKPKRYYNENNEKIIEKRKLRRNTKSSKNVYETQKVTSVSDNIPQKDMTVTMANYSQECTNEGMNSSHEQNTIFVDQIIKDDDNNNYTLQNQTTLTNNDAVFNKTENFIETIETSMTATITIPTTVSIGKDKIYLKKKINSQYYESNINKILMKRKMDYETNSKQILKKRKMNYEANKDTI